MAKNGKINKTTFTDQTNIQNGTSIKSKYIHVKELRDAVVKLESYAKNVVNCGCEACQDTCICQSCQVRNCNCNCSNCSNCDCDCGDDYGSSDGW